MTNRDDEFQRKLLETFAEEANEHVGKMSAALTSLEQAGPADHAALAEAIFRETHTLKGAARAVKAVEVEALCHQLETLFSVLRSGARLPTEHFDLLYQALDRLGSLLADPSPSTRNQARATTKRLSRLAESRAGDGPAAGTSAPLPLDKPRPLGDERLRVDARRLNKVLFQSEGLLSVELALREGAVEAASLSRGLADQQRILAGLRADLRQLEQLLDSPANSDAATLRRGRLLRRLRSAVHAGDDMSKAVHAQSRQLGTRLDQNQRSFGFLRDELTEGIQDISLMPVGIVLEPLARLVRDLAREQSKQVELVIDGADIEVDPRVLEGLRDIFVHLIRNAIDHGIEAAAARAARGKSALATLRIDVRPRDTGLVEVALADDGGGIDLERLAAAAVKSGRISAQAAAKLSTRELEGLALGSGVSTRTEITALSGRGLGLAIVDEKVVALGGKLEIDNQPGLGCRFRIVLPITLASLRGILLSAAGQPFILPTPRVQRVLRVDPGTLRVIEGRQTVRVDGEAMACARLSDLLGLPTGPDARSATAALLRMDGQPLALLFDSVEAEQEVLAKSLGKQLRRIACIAGASVLGDGRLVPILNVADLLSRAARTGAEAVARAPVAPPPAAKRVLVAEDSVTSRLLLKNLIETGGYEVDAVADGLEAYSRLLSAPYDIVVSDVEMPRLNGFGLTEKIRATPAFAQLPVVLITALGSAADKQRGLQAGADAYIVKSSFDQDDLLEILGRLA